MSYTEIYDANPAETRICLELGCTAGTLCSCSECLCFLVCTGECGCLAASKDFDFILQQLLIGVPCINYKKTYTEKTLILFHCTGVPS